MSDFTYDITDKDVKWTQDRYRNDFGITLTREDAYRKTCLFVRQVELTYRPITKQQVQQLNNENEDIDNDVTAQPDTK